MKAALRDTEATEVGADPEFRKPIGRSIDAGGASIVVVVPGGLMIRVRGNSVYQMGGAIAELRNRLGEDKTIEELGFALGSAQASLNSLINDSMFPDATRAFASVLIQRIEALVAEKDHARKLELLERGQFIFEIIQFETVFVTDLYQLDLYWVDPKLGYRTTLLLSEADCIFPESIRAALPDKVREDIREAGRCLAFDLSTAVGFHVLRAVELVVLDYFTIPGWDRGDAKTWARYSRRLHDYNVHRKIRNMIDRLAELHRNELMHAEAVLSKEEAAVLFALAQEVIPLMVADVAKRKGAPIVDFPILNDPRWQ
jgi:hypothetical protein